MPQTADLRGQFPISILLHYKKISIICFAENVGLEGKNACLCCLKMSNSNRSELEVNYKYFPRLQMALKFYVTGEGLA